MTLKYGLILSLFFVFVSVGFAACPPEIAVGSYAASTIILDDEVCNLTGDVWLFDDFSVFPKLGSGFTQDIDVEGTLRLNNANMLFKGNVNSVITVESGGRLEIINYSMLSLNDTILPLITGNLTIIIEEGGELLIENSEIYSLNGLNISSDDILINGLNMSCRQNCLVFKNSDSAEVINVTANGSIPFYVDDYDKITVVNATFIGDSDYNVIDSVGMIFSNVNFSAPGMIVNVDGGSCDFELCNFSGVSGVELENDAIVSYSDKRAPSTSFLSNASFNQRWKTKFTVTNSVGLPLSLVYLYFWNDDINGSNFFTSGFVDGNGYFSQYLSEYVNVDDSIFRYSNYTVDIMKERYDTETIEINLSELQSSVSYNVIMQTYKGIVKENYSCSEPNVDGVWSNFCAEENPVSESGCEDMVAGDLCTVKFRVNATDNIPGSSSLSLVDRSFDFFAIASSSNENILLNESELTNITIR